MIGPHKDQIHRKKILEKYVGRCIGQGHVYALSIPQTHQANERGGANNTYRNCEHVTSLSTFLDLIFKKTLKISLEDPRYYGHRRTF